MSPALLQQAEQRYQKGDLSGALALARQSQRVEALLFQAMLEANRGQPDAALAHLQAYLQKRPNDANAWYNRGLLQAQLGQSLLAQEAYRQALILQPNLLPALVGLAQVLDGEASTDEALNLLQHAWQLLPGQPVVTLALAELVAPDQAEELLREAIAKHPNHARLVTRLGQCLLKTGRFTAALEALDQAAAISGSTSVIQIARTRALLGLGQAQRAVRELVASLETQAADGPARAPLLDALAVAQDAAGQTEVAIDSARKAVALAPAEIRFRYNLASLLSRATAPEKLDEAERLCLSIVDANPAHAGAHQCLGIVYDKQSKADTALQHAQKAVQLEPSASHYLTLADVQIKLDPQAASLTLEAALTEREADPRVLRQLGIARLKLAQPDAALEALDAALALAPHDQRAIAHRAVALTGQGQADAAANYIGLASRITSVEPAVPAGFVGLDEFNRRLAGDIRQHSRMRWEPVGLAARNGGLTDDLTADHTPAISGFETLLRRAIDEYRQGLVAEGTDPFLGWIPGDAGYDLNIWATLVRAGGHIDTHIHEESWLSGAYYVLLPPAAGNLGAIEFGRPHGDLPQAEMAATRVITPREGQLLMFPSFLFHRTLPHEAPVERISISFDVTPR